MANLSAMADKARKWFWEIEVIRGLAALAVVFFHLNEPVPNNYSVYQAICKQGWLGVVVFFVLSGFVIAGARSSSADWKAFLIRRIGRIFPAYWFSLLVVFITAVGRKLFVGVNDVTAFPTSIFQWAGTLVLAVKPFTSVAPINWVYWSLAYELAFYLIISVAMIVRLPLVLPLITSALVLLLRLFHIQLPPPLDWWVFFGLGYALHSLTESKVNIFAFVINLVTILFFSPPPVQLAGAATAAILMLIIRNHHENQDEPPGKTAWKAIAPAVKWISLRVGEASYSVYLIHVPLGVYLLSRLRPPWVFASNGMNLLADGAIALPITLLACLAYRFIEKPGMMLSRKVIQILSNTHAAEP